MENIEVSIIVPVYNVEKYLEECLNSLVEQSFKNIEIVVVDDESPDRSKEIIEKFIKKDNRIKYVFQKNMGLSGARNKGLKLAKGKYIIFIDSDDFIEKNMIETLYGLITRNNADISICDFQYYFSKSNTEPFYIKKKYNINQNIFLLNNENRKKMLSSSNHVWKCLIKTEVIRLNKIKFIEGLLFEDIEFMFKLLSNDLKVVITDKVLYNYRIRGNSITSNLSIGNLYKHSKSKIRISELLEKYLELDKEKKEKLYEIYCEITYPLYTEGIVRLLLCTNIRSKERKEELDKYYQYLFKIKKYKKNQEKNNLKNIVLKYFPIVLNSFTQKYLDSAKFFIKKLKKGSKFKFY